LAHGRFFENQRDENNNFMKAIEGHNLKKWEGVIAEVLSN